MYYRDYKVLETENFGEIFKSVHIMFSIYTSVFYQLIEKLFPMFSLVILTINLILIKMYCSTLFCLEETLIIQSYILINQFIKYDDNVVCQTATAIFSFVQGEYTKYEVHIISH